MSRRFLTEGVNQKVYETQMAAKKIELDAAAALAATEAKAALDGIKGIKTIAQLKAAMAKAAADPSAQKGERRLMALAYVAGVIAATEKKPFGRGGFDAEFNAYSLTHWSDADRPGEASMRQYRSRYGAFYEAGQVKWSRPFVERVIAVKGINLADRAGRMRAIVYGPDATAKAAPLTAAPHEKVVMGILNPVDDDQPVEGLTAIKSLVNAGMAAASNPNVIALLASDATMAAVMRPVIDACISQRQTFANGNNNPASRKAQMEGVAKARAAMAALEEKAEGKPRNKRGMH